MNTDTERYDVVIYCLETREVHTIAGTNMPLESGSFHTAVKRHETVSPRLNDDYGCMIVPAGKYSKGSKLDPEEEGA